MRLEPLCEFTGRYTTQLWLVRPYGGEEGVGYGEGEGTLTGRITGRARWSNHPQKRGDAVFLPDVHGVIETDDGAVLLFSFQGRTPETGEEEGQQLMRATFEAEDDRYTWLNTAFAVAEGRVDLETLEARILVYRCIHEM